MKKILPLTSLMLLSVCLLAQQPFEKYGYKVKIATLSNGKYVEHFDQDTLTQIGSIIINRLNGKIISFVQYDTGYNESDLRPELISRWWSPDPLANEFYNESPYNFVHNNPIRYNDPDGRKPDDIIVEGSVKGSRDYTYVPGQVYQGKDQFIAQTVMTLNYLYSKSPTAAKEINELSNDHNALVLIGESKGDTNAETASSPNIKFDPLLGLSTANGRQSPAVGLAHELGHKNNVRKDGKQEVNSRLRAPDSQYENKEEKKVITQVEQPVVKELNKNGAHEATRDDHKGRQVPVKCPTCIY